MTTDRDSLLIALAAATQARHAVIRALDALPEGADKGELFRAAAALKVYCERVHAECYQEAPA